MTNCRTKVTGQVLRPECFVVALFFCSILLWRFKESNATSDSMPHCNSRGLLGREFRGLLYSLVTDLKVIPGEEGELPKSAAIPLDRHRIATPRIHF
jgi:hypothetical protein